MTTGTFGREDSNGSMSQAARGLTSWLNNKTQDLDYENARLAKKQADEAKGLAEGEAVVAAGEVIQDAFLGRVSAPDIQESEEMTPAERQGITDARNLYARGQKLIEQGQSEAAASAVINHRLLQLAKKHPGLGKEIFEAGRGVETTFLKEADSDTTAARELARKGHEAIYTQKLAWMSAFFPAGSTPTPEQVEERFESSGMGRMMRTGALLDAKLKVVTADASLNDTERKQALDATFRTKEYTSWKGTLMLRVRSLYDEKDDVARERMAMELRNELSQGLADKKISPEESKKYMGDVFDLIDGAEKYKPGQTQFQQLDNQNKLFISQAVKYQNMSQPEVMGTLAVAKVYMESLGPDFVRSQMMQGPTSQAFQQMAKGGDATFATQVNNIATAVYAIKTGRPVEAVTGGESVKYFDYSAPMQQQQQDVATASQMFQAMILNPNNPDKPALAQAYAEMLTSVGRASTGSGSGALRYESVLDQMAADGFVNLIEQQPVLGARLQETADDALTGYTTRLMNDSTKLLGVKPVISNTGGRIIVTIPEMEGSFAQRMEQERVRASVESRLNVASRALAHSLGVKDYATSSTAIVSQFR